MLDPRIREAAGLVLAGPSGSSRARLEGCIRRVYQRVHQASIAHFHEELLGLTDESDCLLGAIGTTPAKLGPLFLEAYLDLPVESLLAERLGRPVARDRLAEVGNLAAASPGTATALVTTLAHRLLEDGAEHAVFTATASTRRVFRRMGAPLVPLGVADGRLLGNDMVRWGSYYDCDPIVCAMGLADLIRQAALVPGLEARLAHLWTAATGSSLRISA